jgi:putative flavoprotein involved in K+ transport
VETRDAVVVGAGPSGLASAAELGRAGARCLVLERSERVGNSWTRHYARLRLHTARWLSGLPGYPIPRRYGRWVARDDFVRYLEEYANHHALEVRFGTTAKRVEPDGDRWRVVTGDADVVAPTVVIATGYNHTPDVPDWPGRDGFPGLLVHSSEYRDPLPYTGSRVLVVGPGNSGAEIALDLSRGGAAEVHLAVRTPPNIQRRDVAGFPLQLVGMLTLKLPPPTIDAISLRLQKLGFGDLEEYGLPLPRRGVYSRAMGEERIPLIDIGTIDAIKKGEVNVVPAVEGFDGPEVLIAGGRRLEVDAVVAATGYRRGLESLVGHLDVLDSKGLPRVRGGRTLSSAPGLHFVGYTNDLGGLLRRTAIEAREVGRAVRKQREVRSG